MNSSSTGIKPIQFQTSASEVTDLQVHVNPALKPNDIFMKTFCQICGCKNIVKDKTCFKNPAKAACIEVIITNRPKSFQEYEVTESGLSDFHKMSVTL